MLSKMGSRKRKFGKSIFEELVTAKNIDFISFEQLKLKITLSVSEKKLKSK